MTSLLDVFILSCLWLHVQCYRLTPADNFLMNRSDETYNNRVNQFLLHPTIVFLLYNSLNHLSYFSFLATFNLEWQRVDIANDVDWIGVGPWIFINVIP